MYWFLYYRFSYNYFNAQSLRVVKTDIIMIVFSIIKRFALKSAEMNLIFILILLYLFVQILIVTVVVFRDIKLKIVYYIGY